MSKITEKAARCERLLKDEDLQQAFQDVRDALHQQFEQTSVTDGSKCLDIRRMLHLLDSVKANIVRAIEDGKVEKAREEGNVEYLGDLWKKQA